MAARYYTSAAYVSGAICGNLWMPNVKAGKPHRFDVRRRLARLSDSRGATFRDLLLSELCEEGADFQDASYTADTVLRIERRRNEGNGKYSVHVREFEIINLRDCADLVDSESYSADFFGDE